MRRAERPSRAPRSTPLWKIPTQVHRSALKIRVMPPAAKEGTFSASSDRCVFFPLAASVPDSGVYPKTRVWGTKPENVHCSRATSPLRIELRWGCEEYSGKTAVGSGVTFKYDPFGRRIFKSSSTATSIYAYDGDNLIEETNAAGTAVARYSQGLNIDEPLAMLRSGTTSYYQADGLGSLTSLSNASGALANTYTYDSFGNIIASTGTLTNSFRYTGREFDTETSLYYYRARYYDSSTGRFTSEDPIRFAAGTNFYTYVDNNPNLFIDPSGYCPNGFRPLNDDERQRLVQAALSDRWNGWGFDPNLKIDEEHKRVACSAFVFVNLQRAGIKVPWTSAYNINKGAPNYFPVQPKELKPGDLLQFDTEGGHLAIATSADPLNGFNFAGSQTSTGPKQVKNWTGIPYWTQRIAGYYQVCLPTN